MEQMTTQQAASVVKPNSTSPSRPVAVAQLPVLSRLASSKNWQEFTRTYADGVALASVVVIASAAISEATRLAIIDFWWAELPPKRRPFLGVACMVSVPCPEGQAALVELLDHLV